MERELLELQKKIYQEESQEYEFFIEYSSRLFFFPVGQFYDLFFMEAAIVIVSHFACFLNLYVNKKTQIASFL